MIAIIDFLTLLVWSLIKLFGSMVLCCCAFLAFMFLMAVIIVIFQVKYDENNDLFNPWHKGEK